MGSDIALSETLGTLYVPGLAVRILPPGKPHLSQKACASNGAVSCDYELMSRVQCLLTPLLTGLLVMLLQLAMAVGLLAPQEPILERYSALVQHDSYCLMNIIDRGYKTIVPPIDHKEMEVSNVAFFPAYPAIAALFRYAFNVDSFAALLITAQLATWGFWTYFFLFCKRWNVSPALQICGTLLIVAHPAAFFLVAGYSESLFLMALLGFIYWSGAEGRSAKFWRRYTGLLCLQRGSSELYAPPFLWCARFFKVDGAV